MVSLCSRRLRERLATTFTLPVPPKVEPAIPSSVLVASIRSIVLPLPLLADPFCVGPPASDSGRAATLPFVVSPTLVGPAFVRSSGVTLTCSTIHAPNHDVATPWRPRRKL